MDTKTCSSRIEAKRLRRAYYSEGVVCQDCGGSTVRYMSNAKCVVCCKRRAAAYYDREKKRSGLPLSGGRARELGALKYLRKRACTRGGHVGARWTKNGECVACSKIGSLYAVDPRYPIEYPPKPSKLLTSRQQALADGRRWFVPTTRCRHCNTLALRYVANGRCLGCSPLRAADNEPLLSGDLTLLNHWPGLTFSREQAAAWGVTIYRTGLHCTRGHTQYRYVTTGECVGCVGRG